MYIVIKKFRSEAIEKSIENTQNAFLPVISKMPGFIDYHMIKSGGDTITSVILFNSKEECDASVAMGSQWVKDNTVDSLYQIQEMITGEVAVKG
jgi:heme-degrading monooxygenase HmoA